MFYNVSTPLGDSKLGLVKFVFQYLPQQFLRARFQDYPANFLRNAKKQRSAVDFGAIVVAPTHNI